MAEMISEGFCMAVRTTTLVPRRRRADPPGGLDAVDARKVDDHQDHVGSLLPAPGDRILAHRKGRHELDAGLPPEQQRERLGEHLVVVHHEHAGRLGHIT
jgi:hypothetical protein